MARTNRSRLLRWLAITVLGGSIIWITFLDSHSLLKRIQWHQEHSQLVEKNEELREEIEVLEEQLQTPPSDELIEQIAREQYGMRQPGETVYRIETEEP